MKRLLLIPIIIFAPLLLRAAPPSHMYHHLPADSNPAPMKVIIIGLVHTGNRVLNTDSLYKTLEALRPSIILREWADDKISLKQRLGVTFGFAHYSVEYAACRKYRAKYHVPVKGYDIDLGDRTAYKKKLQAHESALWRRLWTLEQEGRLNAEQLNLLKTVRQAEQYYLRLVGGGTIADFNTPAISDSTRRLYQVREREMRALLQSHEELAEFRAFFEEDLAFWHRRNKVMAENLLAHIRREKQGCMVVLTGMLHKYYLEDLLSPQQQGFVLAPLQ
jgi:hypothetical protein